MRFVFPEFLYALFALTIPLIIHLFSFRRFKKVYFSNVRFLKEVKQETQSKSKLKHLLVLISRMLAISFLVFAFAQPYIPLENSNISMGENSVSIFIDNSFSMDAINKNGRLFDQAQTSAAEIASAYRNTDRFQVLTNDFEGKHQRLVNKEELQELIDEVKISPASKMLKEIVSRQLDMFNDSKTRNKYIYIISDFQKSVYNINEVKNDSSTKVFLIPIEAQQKGNVYIDSCWFLTPVQQLNQLQQLSVRIKNKSENKIENNPVKLYINEQQKAVASFNADASSEAVVNLSFTFKEPGIQQGRVEISDYPVTFDDQFFFSTMVAKQIHILAINPSTKNGSNATSSKYLDALFGKDSLFQFHNASEDKLDYSSFPNQQLIILNELKTISSGMAQELKKFVGNGGSVLVFPATDIDINSYKGSLALLKASCFEALDTADTKVDRVNYESDLLQNVFDKGKQKGNSNIDLPVVWSHYKISRSTRSNEEAILRLLNGDVFLSKHTFEKGKLYLSSVPLDETYSNFSKHALFVPLVYQLAIYSQPIQQLAYVIGKDEIIEIQQATGGGDNTMHLKSLNNDYDIIPEYKVMEGKSAIYTHSQITQSGNYEITSKDTVIAGLSFNYDRKESNLDCYTEAEMIEQAEANERTNFKIVQSNVKSLSQTLGEINEGKKLWKLCVILALVFLGVEIVLLKFWK